MKAHLLSSPAAGLAHIWSRESSYSSAEIASRTGSTLPTHRDWHLHLQIPEVQTGQTSSGSSDTHTSMGNLCHQWVCAGQAALCWGWRYCDPALPRSYGLRMGIRATSTCRPAVPQALLPLCCCVGAADILEGKIYSWIVLFLLLYFIALYSEVSLLCYIAYPCEKNICKEECQSNRNDSFAFVQVLVFWDFFGVVFVVFWFWYRNCRLITAEPRLCARHWSFYFQLMEIFCNNILVQGGKWNTGGSGGNHCVVQHRAGQLLHSSQAKHWPEQPCTTAPCRAAHSHGGNTPSPPWTALSASVLFSVRGSRSCWLPAAIQHGQLCAASTTCLAKWVFSYSHPLRGRKTKDLWKQVK